MSNDPEVTVKVSLEESGILKDLASDIRELQNEVIEMRRRLEMTPPYFAERTWKRYWSFAKKQVKK